MAGKRMLTARMKEGMILDDDVYTSEEQLLIPKGTALTQEIIAALKEHSVFAARIRVGEDGKTPVTEAEVKEEAKEQEEATEQELQEPLPEAPKALENMQYYEKVRETEEFKVFNEAFVQTVDSLKDTFNHAVMNNEEIDSDQILGEVENVVSKSRNSLHILDMLQCMKGYDDMTYVHCLNVAILSNLIARTAIHDISKKDLDALTLAGLLHDIGKIMIPDEVLQKEGKLTPQEFNLVKTHVLQGNNILKNKGMEKRVTEAVMRHHERCDGSGYPGGYSADKISPFAKILAIADTFDAMTSKRPYRDEICPFKVIHMFEREAIEKYDAEFVVPFLHAIVQAYMNTEVELSNGKRGKVVMINKNDLSRPIVKIGSFYCDLSKEKDVYIDKMVV